MNDLVEYCTRCNRSGHLSKKCETVLCQICYKFGHSVDMCRRNLECSNCLMYGHISRECYKNICRKCNFPINYINIRYHVNGNCTNPNFFCRECGYSCSYNHNCNNGFYARFSPYILRRKSKEKIFREKLKKTWFLENRKRIKRNIKNHYLNYISKDIFIKWDNISRNVSCMKYYNIYSLNECILYLEKNKTEQINNIYDNISFDQKLEKTYILKIQKLNEKINEISNKTKQKEKEVTNIINYSEKLISLLNEKDIDKCMICLGKIPLNSVVVSKCGHFYCIVCIQKTIEKTNKCGYCREKLKKGDYILCDIINKNFVNYKKFIIK